MKKPPHIDKNLNPVQTYEDTVQKTIKQPKANMKKDEDNLGDNGIDSQLIAMLRRQCKCKKENVCTYVASY